eukprot:1403282-Pyramimonas_sp.AAC.1
MQLASTETPPPHVRNARQLATRTSSREQLPKANSKLLLVAPLLQLIHVEHWGENQAFPKAKIEAMLTATKQKPSTVPTSSRYRPDSFSTAHVCHPLVFN